MRKAGFTLLKTIVKNVEICGEKLTIKTLPIKGRRINPMNLGIIGTEGEITFANQAMAEKYAISRVIAPLKKKEPFERAVILKGNTVFAELNGNSHRVFISDELLAKATDTLVIHGHPDTYARNITTPISIPDYMQIGTNFNEIRAYSSSGEYSLLRLLPECKDSVVEGSKSVTTILPKLEISKPKFGTKLDFKKICNMKCVNNAVNITKREVDVKKINEFIFKGDKFSIEDIVKKMQTGDDQIKDKIYKSDIQRKFIEEFIKILAPEEKKIAEAARKMDKEAIMKFDTMLKDFQMSENGRRFIHDFWNKYSREFGVEYKTNYSALA